MKAGINMRPSPYRCAKSLFRNILNPVIALGRTRWFNEWLAMLERRTYPLLAVVLTAAFICVSVWRCPEQPCSPIPSPMAATYQLLHHNTTLLQEPYDRTQLGTSDFQTLIDLHNFTFLINSPVCNASSPPLYVVLVHTAPSHGYNRRTIRETWGRNVPLVFLLGDPGSATVQESLDRENAEHHDLVQGNFLDSYRNMTYKHVSGLKWVTYFCSSAKYILKVDDDVFVNSPYLEVFLSQELSPLGARHLVLCDVLTSSMVKRSFRSKWRVSPREYPGRWYPNYCMGFAILYSPDIVFLLYREAQRTPYFWIDDVHVTGTLMSQLNLSHTGLGTLALSEQRAHELLFSNFMPPPEDFLFSLISPSVFQDLWKFVVARWRR